MRTIALLFREDTNQGDGVEHRRTFLLICMTTAMVRVSTYHHDREMFLLFHENTNQSGAHKGL